MKGMKKGIAALALCAAACICAHADTNADALFKAAEDNNVAEVERLIKSGVDVNAHTPDYKKTALMFAAEHNSLDVARLLISKGANVNAQIPVSYGGGGDTPILYAAKNNSVDMAKMLIAAGADVNKRAFNHTPLTMATAYESWDVAKLLIAAKAEVNPKLQGTYCIYETPLMHAAKYNAVDMVKLLIKAGANVNAWSIDNLWHDDPYGALMVAAERNSIESARLLLAAGANVNQKAKDGRSALFEAAVKNNQELVDMFIAAGAELNITCWPHNRKNVSPLMGAAEENNVEIVKKLIAAGADVNLKQTDDETALMWAAKGNAADAIQVLVAAGADINAMSRHDTYDYTYSGTALMWAAKENKPDAVRALIKAGADVNIRSEDYTGETALMEAATLSGKTGEDIVQALIDGGADVNAKDKNGRSVIEYARDSAVKKLLSKASAAQAKDVKEKSRRQEEDEYLRNSANAETMEWIKYQDKRRDDLYEDLRQNVESTANSPWEDLAKSAKTLIQCFKENEIDPKLPFDKKTELYTKLIKDLKGKYALQVNHLHKELRVESIKKANEEVRKLTKQLK